MSNKRQSAVKKFEIYFYGLKTDEAKQIEAAHVYDIISPFLRKRKAAIVLKGKKKEQAEAAAGMVP